MRVLIPWLAAACSLLLLAAQGPPPALVETAPVREAEFFDQLTLVGRTEARSESRIVAEIAGRVRSVDAVEGRRMRRGAVLVSVDCRRIELSLEAKRAESAQAKAEAELARSDLQRAQDLVSTEVFPERQLQSAAATADRNEERHRQLEAEVRQLELDVENCAIKAPFSGHAVQKLVDVGEWVEPGTPVYEMVDLGRVKVTVDLPERRFGQVEVGSPATITVAGQEAAPIAAEVSGIAPRASEATHTFPVLLSVKNRDGRLGSGMLVEVTLRLAGTFQSLAVPTDAIVRQGDATVVYTVEEGKAVQVPVRVRASRDDLVAVEVTGKLLAAGQPVVVRGNERLFPGQAVLVGGGSAP